MEYSAILLLYYTPFYGIIELVRERGIGLENTKYKEIAQQIINCYICNNQTQFNLSEYEQIKNITPVMLLNIRVELACQGYLLTSGITNNTPYTYKLRKTKLLKEYEKLKGYVNKDSKKPGPKPVTDPNLVKLIYSMYTDDLSCTLSQIANYLNSNGYSSLKGKKWYKSTISYILQNKAYVDLSLIDNETFLKAQTKLQLNKRKRV